MNGASQGTVILVNVAGNKLYLLYLIRIIFQRQIYLYNFI
jgi:hypothetical protein